MNVRFEPARGLSGELQAPPDKSISHRAALLGAMAAEPVRIERYLHAADTDSTLEAVRALGALVELRDGDEVVVRGTGLREAREPEGPINVSFDRYGNEVGSRGIRHNDFDPARPVSRPSDQGGAGDRGPALLRAFRHRHRRHRARAGHQRQAGGVVQGGSSITQQLAKNLFLSQRAHARAQDQGSVPRACGWKRG